MINLLTFIIGGARDTSAPTDIPTILFNSKIGGVRDNVVSIDNTDYEIGPLLSPLAALSMTRLLPQGDTLSDSEGPVALGDEMLRCAQHDKAAMPAVSPG